MPSYVIKPRKKIDPPWQTVLANCSLEHAQSVLDHLETNTSVPNDLVLEELTADPPRRPWWRRLKRG